MHLFASSIFVLFFPSLLVLCLNFSLRVEVQSDGHFPPNISLI